MSARQNGLKSNFFYVAPPFNGFAGHYFNYAHGLAHACQDRGISFLAVGARQIEHNSCFPGDLPFLSLFDEPGPLFLAGLRIRGLGKFRNRLLWSRALRDLTALPGFNAEAFCLVEEPRLFSVGALSQWLQGLPDNRSPSFGFLFRYGLKSADGLRWLTSKDPHAVILKELAETKKKIFILSDSHLVAQHLRELTKLPVQVIPLHIEVPDSNRGYSVDDHKDQVHFYIPGIAANTKGTPLLINALRLLKDNLPMASMRFTIPLYPTPHPNPEVDTGRAILETLRLPNVEILYHSLGRNEYYERLCGADVVLTPYEPDRYQATSGPFAEALALGKPVICSKHTWMSAMLDEGYGAGLTFPFGDVHSLAESLIIATRDFKELALRASLSQASWCARNGSRAILDALFQEVMD